MRDRRRKPRAALAALALLVALDPAAFAASSYTNFAKPLMANVLLTALPTRPIASGALDVKLVAASAQFGADSSANSNINTTGSTQGLQTFGGGYGASVVYGLGEHLAAGGLVGYGSEAGVDFNANAVQQTAIIINADLIYDPFSGDNFRLPIMAGLGYINSLAQDNGASLDGIALGPGWKDIYKTDSPALSLGIAPQFNTGFLRWILFAYTTNQFQKSSAFDPNTGTLTTRASGGGTTGGSGLAVTVRPMEATFYYIPGFLSDVSGVHSTVFGFAFEHRFLADSREGAGVGYSR